MGTTYTWNDGTTGDWSDPSNWSPNGVPGSQDIANVLGSSTETITAESEEAVDEFYIDNANVSFSISSVFAVNQGTIGGENFTNSGGLLEITSNGSILLDPANFSNLQSNSLSGSYEVDSNAGLVIETTQQITTDNGSLYLVGPGSVIDTRNPNTGLLKKLASMLITVGTGGLLDLLEKRNYITSENMINFGTVSEGGGASLFKAPSIINDGTINSNTSFDINSNVTGTGTDTITNTAVLEFDGTVGSDKTRDDQTIEFVNKGGTLTLSDPKGFFGVVENFALGDTIKLQGSWDFTSVTHPISPSNTTLTLHEGATKHSFDFTGDYTKGEFHIASGKITSITY